MFGRRHKAQREFAQRTIDDKVSLMNAVLVEASTGVWFEEGDFPRGRAAVESYAQRILTTEDIVFLTVNSLPSDVRARAESTAPELLGTLSYPQSGEFGASPAYYAGNNLFQSLMGGDIGLSAPETDQSIADQAISHGLMRGSYDAMRTMDQEAWMQNVVVATTLAAGWLISPERAKLAN